jgi:hypothetical protein
MQGKRNAKEQAVTADAEMEEAKSEQPARPKKSRSRSPAPKNQQRRPLHAPPTAASNKKIRGAPAKAIESEVSPMETSATKTAAEIKKTMERSGNAQEMSKFLNVMSFYVAQ